MAADDYEAMAALWRAIPGMGLHNIDDSRAGIEKYLARNPGLSLVAHLGDELAGTILCGHDGRRGVIYHACVAPAHQGHGLGKALVGGALAGLKAEGISKVLIVVFRSNESGKAFWQHMGWLHRDDLDYYNVSLVADT